jgi:C1A family cysteine protease
MSTKYAEIYLRNVNPDYFMEHKYSFGWIPDIPDFRDYTTEHPEVQSTLVKLNIHGPASTKSVPPLPPNVDLRQYCSPIRDQGNLGSCTAEACVGALEYFERRAFGNDIKASPLFLYKVTRDLIQVTGDTGACGRNAMGALATIGACPEKYWPYNTARYDNEPPTLCYLLAGDYKSTQYVRLDIPNISNDALLKDIKTYLAIGIPAIYGFTVYSSIDQATNTGRIPFPGSNDSILGGHENLIVGYEDDMQIKNSETGKVTTGALITRNSWGTSWGDAGCGYLPYDYVLKGVTQDWWVMLKDAWIDTGKFGF